MFKIIQGVVIKRLLDQKVRLGIFSYDCGADFQGEFCFHHPVLLYARKFEELRTEISYNRKNDFYKLDQKSFLIIPAEYKIKLTSVDENCSFTFLFPNANLYPLLRQHCVLEKAKFDRIFSKLTLLKRKNWMNEIFLRYVFEMVETKNRDNYVVKFLELEIMKELYFNHYEQLKHVNEYQFSPSIYSVEREVPLAQKAYVYIENNLFKNLTVKQVAKGIGTSEATLLRTFRKNLNKSVDEYIRDRKLQEAKFLIKSKQHNVSETAFLLGYNSLSAFTNAFKKQFMLLPSKL